MSSQRQRIVEGKESRVPLRLKRLRTLEYTRMPTVFIVDDELHVRQTLELVLGASGFKVESFSSAEEFLRNCIFPRRGCLILDLCLEGMSGIELQGCMAARRVSLPIVFLSGRADIPTAVLSMQRGAVQFLTKPFDRHHLLASVGKAIQLGELWYGAAIEPVEAQRRFETLKPCEKRVMALMVAGFSQKQIAARLDIALRTVQLHRTNLMQKMGVESLAELVKLSISCGPTRLRPAVCAPATSPGPVLSCN
ncbi:MAG: hypothetical protein AMXMBFR13_13640 [Phycisphaerae bacterium]